MSKNKHLIVSKKTKRKVKKSSNKSGQEVGVGGDGAIRENNEQRWEAISSRLSAILQGIYELNILFYHKFYSSFKF